MSKDLDWDYEDLMGSLATSTCGIKESHSGKNYHPEFPERVSEMKYSELYQLSNILNIPSFFKVQEINEFKTDLIINEAVKRKVKEHFLLGKYFSLKIDYSKKYIFKIENMYNFWEKYDHHWIISEDDKDDTTFCKKNYVTDYDIKFLLDIDGYFVNDGKIITYSTHPKNDYQFGTTTLFGASDDKVIFKPFKLKNLLSNEEWWEDDDATIEISNIAEEDFYNIKRTYDFIKI